MKKSKVQRRTIILSVEGPFPILVAAQLADLTPWMVEYLAREEIVVPSYANEGVRGRKRLWTFGDVVILRCLAKLFKSGVSVKRLKDSLFSNKSMIKKISKNISYDSTLKKLVSDGINVIFLDESRGKESYISQSGQYVFEFVIDINFIRREVHDTYSKMSPEEKSKKWRHYREFRTAG